MANFDGFTPHPIERFTSLVEQDDPTNLPLGVAAVCRNARFHLTGVRSRDGLNQKVGNAWVGLNMGTGFPITGAYSFKYSGNGVVPDKQVPLIFDQNGNLKIESPPGSGVLVPVESALVTPGTGNYLQAAQTLNRAYLAFTNIANPSAQASSLGVYDLNTGILDPLSMKGVGGPWLASTAYVVGECVCSVKTPTLGKIFRCIQAGTTAAIEPNWNAGDGANTNDGTVIWQENTPLFALCVPPPDSIGTDQGIIITPNYQQAVTNTSPASGFSVNSTRVAGAGAFAAGRDLYLAATLLQPSGAESMPVFGIISQNTALNDRYQVKVPNGVALRAWLANLGGGLAPTTWQLYEADVVAGGAPPALSVYHKVAGGPFSLAVGTTVNVDNTAAGAIPPIAGTSALVAPSPGNVPYPTNATSASAQRFMVVLYVNRNGYISGWGPLSPVEFNVAGGVAGQFNNGAQLLVINLPTGPPQTVQRIVAFSQAGGTQAGPFAYIPENANDAGIPITSTVINDNVTTTAIFNFTDSHLEDLMATDQNVTSFFDKIQIPPCRSVTYLETLDRMAYFAYALPSGAYITPAADPETVLGTNGSIEVAETDGQQLMGLIDFKGVTYALKERSGHEVNPSADNPSQWTYTKRWEGMGPCGVRAFDSGTHFFVFVHRSGVYFSAGDVPTRLIKEIPITWGRINWNAAATIWAKIDENTHEILIGVPLDRATVPSHVLSINYEESINLDPPVHSTIYSRGKFISSAAARKWSVQDIGANSCVRTERTVLNPPPQFDTATVTSQLWFASSYDSAIRAQTPGLMSDDWSNFAIPFIYETVCPGDALKLCRLGGVQVLASGQGAVGVSVLAGSTKATQDGGINTRSTEIRMKDMIMKPGTTTDYKCQGTGINERYRIRFSCQGKPAGSWADLKTATLFLNPVFQAR